MEVMASVTSWLQALQGPPAYALVFGALVASGFWLPVNEDLLVMAAAALTLQGVMDPLPLAVTAWAGVLCADLLIFHWGHRFGGRLLEHPLLARAMPPARLARMQARIRRLGPAYLALVRFAPGLRSAMLFAAGSLRIPYRQLLLFDGLAGAVELPLLIVAVRWVGGRWQDIVDALPGWPAMLGALLALVLLAAWLAWRRTRGSSRRND